MTDIDRVLVRRAFATYIEAYDISDPKIKLKVDHTYRVASLCDRIARSIDMSQSDVDLAWLLGILHDIGRFEQVRRYGTFNDAISVSHAALGVSVLFDDGHINDYLPKATQETLELVKTAVATHSDYRLQSGIADRTRVFCDILRDADKIDILKANTLTPTADIFDVPEEQIEASPVSQRALDGFYEHRTLRRDERTSPADSLISYACFVFELVYPESVRIAQEQGHVFDVLRRPYTNSQTTQTMHKLEEHMRSWIDARLTQGDILKL